MDWNNEIYNCDVLNTNRKSSDCFDSNSEEFEKDQNENIFKFKWDCIDYEVESMYSYTHNDDIDTLTDTFLGDALFDDDISEAAGQVNTHSDQLFNKKCTSQNDENDDLYTSRIRCYDLNILLEYVPDEWNDETLCGALTWIESFSLFDQMFGKSKRNTRKESFSSFRSSFSSRTSMTPEQFVCFCNSGMIKARMEGESPQELMIYNGCLCWKDRFGMVLGSIELSEIIRIVNLDRTKLRRLTLVFRKLDSSNGFMHITFERIQDAKLFGRGIKKLLRFQKESLEKVGEPGVLQAAEL